MAGKLEVSIEYCNRWGYLPQAVRVAEEILKAKGEAVAGLRLVPSSGGVFEVMAGGKKIFSKKALGRHAEPGEVLAALESK